MQNVPAFTINGKPCSAAEYEAHDRKLARQSAEQIKRDGGAPLVCRKAGTDGPWVDLTRKSVSRGVARRVLKSKAKVRAILRRVLAPTASRARSRAPRTARRSHRSPRLAAPAGSREGPPPPRAEPENFTGTQLDELSRILLRGLAAADAADRAVSR